MTCFSPRFAQLLPKESEQRVRLERLSEIAEHAGRRSARGEHVVVGRNEDDPRRRASSLERILQIEAAQSAEVDVEHDAPWLTGDIPPEILFGGFEGLDVNAIDAKSARERST